MLRAGNISLGTIAQANGKTKERPVLLLARMPKYGDWLVCGISSKIHNEITDFDELLPESDAEFAGSGLTLPSLIRTGFVGLMPETEIPGILGAISETRANKILSRLAVYLAEQAKSAAQ